MHKVILKNGNEINFRQIVGENKYVTIIKLTNGSLFRVTNSLIKEIIWAK